MYIFYEFVPPYLRTSIRSFGTFENVFYLIFLRRIYHKIMVGPYIFISFPSAMYFESENS